MLDVKKLLSKILNSPFIVEEGTSGIWTYRKWSNGVAECWGVYSATVSHNTTVFGGYGYYVDVSFPTGLFISAPEVQYSANIGSYFALTGTVTTQLTKDSNRYYAVVNGSGSRSTQWYISAKGKWK